MTQRGSGTKRWRAGLAAVLLGVMFMPLAPALAQRSDEEPSRRRSGEEPGPEPAFDAPLPERPSPPPPPDEAPPRAGELVPPPGVGPDWAPRPTVDIPASPDRPAAPMSPPPKAVVKPGKTPPPAAKKVAKPKPEPAPPPVPEPTIAAPVPTEEKIDLSGVWETKNFVLRLEQVGQDITAVIVKPSARASSGYGYKAGGQMFVGRLEGTTVKGNYRGHFTLGARAQCPDQWEGWDPFELTLSEDGKQLHGRKKDSRIHWPGCRIKDRGWKKYTLSRKDPEARPAPPATAPAPPPKELAEPDKTPPPPPAKKRAKKMEMIPPAAQPAPETETARLLRQGKALLAAQRLTTPKGGSAIDRFRQVLAIDPGNGEAEKGIAKIATTYRQWGSRAIDRKEYAKAERYLVKSTEIDGEDAAAYAFLGYARVDQGKYQGAIEAFNRALEIRPGTADYHSGIGIATFRMEDYGAAIEAFEQAVAKRPDHADSHRMIGIANERLGNWRQAVEGYSRAYAIEPAPGSDDLALGRLHVRLKEYGKAVPYLERAAGHYPENPVVFDYLATAHHFLENISEALAAVETRNRLEREGAKGAGKGKKEEKKVAAVPPAAKPGASKPPPKNAKAPLSGAAEARASFDAGRHATAYNQYKAEAAKGNAEAAYMLGRMRHQGIGGRRDLAKAFDWYLKAARAGHAGGQAGVGYMYYRGQGGVRRDHGRAAQWFEKAAKGGITGAMARLARMYERGEGVERNSRTASYWYIMAARRGNRVARKRLRELGTSPNSPSFSGPDEIESGLGELPALSTPTTPVTTAMPTTAPKPKPERKSRPCGGGLLGGLSCAGK